MVIAEILRNKFLQLQITFDVVLVLLIPSRLKGRPAGDCQYYPQ